VNSNSIVSEIKVEWTFNIESGIVQNFSNSLHQEYLNIMYSRDIPWTIDHELSINTPKMYCCTGLLVCLFRFARCCLLMHVNISIYIIYVHIFIHVRNELLCRFFELVGLYLYIYVCVYMYMYMGMCVYIYIYWHVWVYMYIYIFTYIHVYIRIYIYMYIHVYTHIYWCKQTYIHTCIYITTYIYSYMYIFTYTWHNIQSNDANAIVEVFGSTQLSKTPSYQCETLSFSPKSHVVLELGFFLFLYLSLALCNRHTHVRVCI